MAPPRRGLDPRLVARRRNVDSTWWHWLVNGVAASPAFGRRQRARLLRLAGIQTGQALIEPGCFFFGSDARLGDWSLINHRCYFDTRDRIEVGSSCSLGMEVMLCTSTHEVGAPERRAGTYRTAPIRIGDGVWIGTRAVVLPGVSVGDGAIVAAGAVVTEDVPAHTLVAGVPARPVRELDGA